MLKKPLLQTPRLGVLNRHGSLLPLSGAWRRSGRTPPSTGARHDLPPRGRGLDTGPIVLQRPLAVDGRASYPRSWPSTVMPRPRFLEAVELWALPAPCCSRTPRGHAHVQVPTLPKRGRTEDARAQEASHARDRQDRQRDPG
jgi:hypothetical protein